MKKFLSVLTLILVLTLSYSPGNALTPAKPAQAGSSSLPLLLGVYASADLQTTIGEISGMDTWLASQGVAGVTFAGDFVSITFNPGWNVEHELDAAWDNGFVPFVNLMSSASWEGSYFDASCDTAAEIAAGSCDAKLAIFANYYKAWVSKGNDRRAFLAPLPEANSDWIGYATDGATFIKAFLRIRQVFENQGVPRNSVRWVFAPNGWNDPAYSWRAFEYYYPGDLNTDVIAFSAYNYGGCPVDSPWRIWDTFETAVEPYLIRMRSLAPSKPIFISQMGTVGVADNPSDSTQTKSNWISDTFSKLADYPAVRGVIYFNMVKYESSLVNCPSGADYRVYYGGSSGEQGLVNIMSDSRWGKWATTDSRWSSVAFVDTTYIFSDVMPSEPFSGAPNVWYYDAVMKLYNAGITTGYSDGTYRPANTTTRAEMAVFLLKALHSASYTPPVVSPTFSDTSGHWAANWIEALRAEGITSGYPDGTYRPDNTVTRAEMAVFLLKAKNGASYFPPDATPTFSDTSGSWAVKWIEALKATGITSGYPDGTYKPDNTVTRAEMAAFLVKAFNLP